MVGSEAAARYLGALTLPSTAEKAALDLKAGYCATDAASSDYLDALLSLIEPKFVPARTAYTAKLDEVSPPARRVGMGAGTRFAARLVGRGSACACVHWHAPMCMCMGRGRREAPA